MPPRRGFEIWVDGEATKIPLLRSYCSSSPKNNRSHGSSSFNSTAFPVEIKNDFMFSVMPSPEKTTMPGIGHTAMS